MNMLKPLCPHRLTGKPQGTVPGKEETVERKPSPEEPFSAFVFKTLADPYVGRINFSAFIPVLNPIHRSIIPTRIKQSV